MGCNFFGGNCCTWLVVILILWIFSNDGGLFGNNGCCNNGCNNGCGRDYSNGCGC